MAQPVMIVTGASRGLGAQIAARAVDEGFRVVLAARDLTLLEAQSRRLEENGGKAICVQADVSRYADCRKIVEQAAGAFGRIDVLVNNAAVIEPLARVAEDRHEEWARLIAVNLTGPAMLCQLAIPHLRETQGRVIQVTSAAGVYPVPGASAYCASKAGLNHFSAVLALEEPEITVLSVHPGDMHTDMQAVIRDKGKGKANPQHYDFMVALYEEGKLLPPGEPARAVVALALHAPREWSGQVLNWDDERVAKLVSPG